MQCLSTVDTILSHLYMYLLQASRALTQVPMYVLNFCCCRTEKLLLLRWESGLRHSFACRRGRRAPTCHPCAVISSCLGNIFGWTFTVEQFELETLTPQWRSERRSLLAIVVSLFLILPLHLGVVVLYMPLVPTRMAGTVLSF